MATVADRSLVFDRRAVFVPAASALIVADLHIGKEATAPVDFPLGERRDLRTRIGHLLDRYKPTTVVFAGDVLHDFRSRPRTVDVTLQTVIECVRHANADVLVAIGNHDRQLTDPGLDCREYIVLDDDILVAHGHQDPDRHASMMIIGHEHPAIRIEGRKRPCFLLANSGPTPGAILVLPAFNRIVRGVDVLRTSALHSPFLPAVRECFPIVYDHERETTMSFPSIERMRAIR